MKILQAIEMEWDMVYVFADEPYTLLKELVEWYENETYKIHLWCTEPELTSFKFLGKSYDCIGLWYDKQDDIAKDAAREFNRLTKD